MTSNLLTLSNRQLDLALHAIPDPTSTDERSIQKAIISMKMIVREIDSDPDFIHAYASTLGYSWPNIWEWITFIHHRCVIERRHGEPLRDHSLRVIPDIITALCRQYEPSLHPLVFNTSGIFELVTPYWLREDIDNKRHLTNDTRFAANFSTALTFLLPPDHVIPRLLSLIIDSAEGGETEVARVAISHARAVFLCGNRDYDDSAVVHLQLIFSFLRQECPSLKLAMFKEGSMEAVVSILDMIAGESPEAVDIEAMMTCYGILSRALTVACSLTFITEGLHAGLLQAMLRGGRHLMHPDMPPIIVKTALACFEKVHQLMVYRSFLRPLGKAVKTTDGNGIDEHTSGPLWDAWRGLKVTTVERLKDMDVFDRKEIDREKVSDCTLLACQVRRSGIKLKRCTGCLEVFYCSTTCQKLDWKNHKAQCLKIQDDRQKGTMMPISTLDRGFLHYVAFADIQKHLTEVLSIIKSNYPTTPYSSLLVRMDYSDPPMEPLVILASSFTYVDDEEKRCVQDLLKLSGLSAGGQITLICFVLVPGTPMTERRSWPQLAVLRLPGSNGMAT
ncbi:hypothetical protein PILCRDRAFT_16617 [Piloderma croceum F 1598]|uniref:MYND-type domain-containing protein n=1 Tax=Piloderma croceum (strain F 1598) TaxID=765440 RepID=A0A0C3EGU9_PILCF|nr:hypothetical protein PILCRDRAFT_16617 [Piloderma croceum F 1598]